MPTWENNWDDESFPPARSFAVVGPMPERLRRAFELRDGMSRGCRESNHDARDGEDAHYREIRDELNEFRERLDAEARRPATS